MLTASFTAIVTYTFKILHEKQKKPICKRFCTIFALRKGILDNAKNRANKDASFTCDVYHYFLKLFYLQKSDLQ